MTPNKNYHWRIAGFYFFYFAFVGMFAPYWSLYLQSIHFDAIQIAILMSVQPVMRMIAPNLWGWLADRTGKRLLVVQIAALGAALSYLGRVLHHAVLWNAAGDSTDELFLECNHAAGGGDYADLSGQP